MQEIEEAIRQGSETHDDIKRLTRCGMGPCQAKICRGLVAGVIAEKTKKEVSSIPVPRLRVPLRPTPVGVLAAHHEGNMGVISVLDELHQVEGGNERD